VDGAKLISRVMSPLRLFTGASAYCVQLTTLKLAGNAIGNDGAAAIAAALQLQEQRDGSWRSELTIEHLDLTDNGIEDEGLVALATALAPRRNVRDGTYAYIHTLRRLKMNHNAFGLRGAKALSEVLRLRRDRQGCWVRASALEAVTLNVELAVGPILRGERADLSLANAGLEAVDAAVIAAALHPHVRGDEEADRGDSGAACAFPHVVHAIDLSYNSIGADGAAALAEALSPRELEVDVRGGGGRRRRWCFNRSLRKLNLRSNGIGAEGCAALAELFSLRRESDGSWVSGENALECDLSWNSAGAVGGTHIAEALSPALDDASGEWTFPRSLGALNFSWNLLGDDGCRAFAEALRPRRNDDADGRAVSNDALASLSLAKNDISAEGLRTIRGALVHARPNFADLCHNSITRPARAWM